MTGTAIAQQLKRGDDEARVAVARERLISTGHTRAEIEGMPDGDIIRLAAPPAFCPYCAQRGRFLGYTTPTVATYQCGQDDCPVKGSFSITV